MYGMRGFCTQVFYTTYAHVCSYIVMYILIYGYILCVCAHIWAYTHIRVYNGCIYPCAFYWVALLRFPGGPAGLYLTPMLAVLNKCVHRRCICLILTLVKYGSPYQSHTRKCICVDLRFFFDFRKWNPYFSGGPFWQWYWNARQGAKKVEIGAKKKFLHKTWNWVFGQF